MLPELSKLPSLSQTWSSPATIFVVLILCIKKPRSSLHVLERTLLGARGKNILEVGEEI